MRSLRGLRHDLHALQSGRLSLKDGALSARPSAFEHGDRQARRPLRLSRRHALVDRSLLSGDRPRRPADGLPADTFTLYSAGDIELRRRQILESGATDERKRVEMAKLDDLVALADEAAAAARRFLPCSARIPAPAGAVEHRLAGRIRLIDRRVEAQGDVGHSTHLGPVLAAIGEHSPPATETVLRHGHDELKTFGAGKDRAPAEWRGVLRQLQSGGLVGRGGVADPADAPGRGAAGAARRGPVRTAKDVVNPKARRRRVAEAVAASGADAELLAALKVLRGGIAAAQKQPAYVISPIGRSSKWRRAATPD